MIKNFSGKVLCTIVAMVASVVTGSAWPVSIEVDSRANVFGAGSGDFADGVAPAEYRFQSATPGVLTFASVTGLVTGRMSELPFNGPDGSAGSEPGVSPPHLSLATAGSGLSAGISVGHSAFFLAGVFLGPTLPMPPAVSPLDFGTGGLGIAFAELRPAIGQIFFIGDGLTGTGSGASQRFLVPVGASRLFLGLADGCPQAARPGCYADNAGSFVATFDITPVPEPGSLFMMAVGALLAASIGCRRDLR